MSHYVWSEDGTRLVEKDGDIDMSRPFFLLAEPVEEDPVGPARDDTQAVWPEGWIKIGATVDVEGIEP